MDITEQNRDPERRRRSKNNKLPKTKPNRTHTFTEKGRGSESTAAVEAWGKEGAEDAERFESPGRGCAKVVEVGGGFSINASLT